MVILERNGMYITADNITNVENVKCVFPSQLYLKASPTSFND